MAKKRYLKKQGNGKGGALALQLPKGVTDKQSETLSSVTDYSALDGNRSDNDLPASHEVQTTQKYVPLKIDIQKDSALLEVLSTRDWLSEAIVPMHETVEGIYDESLRKEIASNTTGNKKVLALTIPSEGLLHDALGAENLTSYYRIDSPNVPEGFTSFLIEGEDPTKIGVTEEYAALMQVNLSHFLSQRITNLAKATADIAVKGEHDDKDNSSIDKKRIEIFQRTRRLMGENCRIGIYSPKEVIEFVPEKNISAKKQDVERQPTIVPSSNGIFYAGEDGPAIFKENKKSSFDYYMEQQKRTQQWEANLQGNLESVNLNPALLYAKPKYGFKQKFRKGVNAALLGILGITGITAFGSGIKKIDNYIDQKIVEEVNNRTPDTSIPAGLDRCLINDPRYGGIIPSWIASANIPATDSNDKLDPAPSDANAKNPSAAAPVEVSEKKLEKKEYSPIVKYDEIFWTKNSRYENPSMEGINDSAISLDSMVIDEENKAADIKVTVYTSEANSAIVAYGGRNYHADLKDAKKIGKHGRQVSFRVLYNSNSTLESFATGIEHSADETNGYSFNLNILASEKFGKTLDHLKGITDNDTQSITNDDSEQEDEKRKIYVVDDIRAVDTQQYTSKLNEYTSQFNSKQTAFASELTHNCVTETGAEAIYKLSAAASANGEGEWRLKDRLKDLEKMDVQDYIVDTGNIMQFARSISKEYANQVAEVINAKIEDNLEKFYAVTEPEARVYEVLRTWQINNGYIPTGMIKDTKLEIADMIEAGKGLEDLVSDHATPRMCLAA